MAHFLPKPGGCSKSPSLPNPLENRSCSDRSLPSMGSYLFPVNPSAADNDDRNNTYSSHFNQTVCLHDWWLVKAQKDFNGKKLAVQGLTSRGKQAVRVFSSAPIVKRCDLFTLETADGVCIFLRGFMNKERTSENGFSSEACRHLCSSLSMLC